MGCSQGKGKRNGFCRREKKGKEEKNPGRPEATKQEEKR